MHAAITIGFVPNRVSVSESTGSVQLCARVMGENVMLERDVILNFNTADGDSAASDNPATGKSESAVFNTKLST